MFDRITDPWYVFDWKAYCKEGDAWIPSAHNPTRWSNIVTLTLAEKGPASSSDKSPIQGFYRGAHGTEDDAYFQLFQKSQASRRRFRFDDADAVSSDASFEFIGLLASPETKALEAVERARVLKDAGAFQGAIDQFSIAIELASHIGYPGLIFVERGDMYLAIGRKDLARCDYKEAIRRNPSEASFIDRLANVIG
jgi:tetratricopeptide (TPR) repeat protein